MTWKKKGGKKRYIHTSAIREGLKTFTKQPSNQRQVKTMDTKYTNKNGEIKKRNKGRSEVQDHEEGSEKKHRKNWCIKE